MPNARAVSDLTSTIALQKAVDRNNTTLAQVRRDMVKAGFFSDRTFGYRLQLGGWKADEAKWLAQRLPGLSRTALLDPKAAPEPVDSELLSECYLMFITALAEDDLLEHLTPDRQADAFSAWFRQCNAIGTADPSILHDWLRILAEK
jgi:hypothetical protein